LPTLRATEKGLAADRAPALRQELAHSVGILRFGLGQS